MDDQVSVWVPVCSDEPDAIREVGQIVDILSLVEIQVHLLVDHLIGSDTQFNVFIKRLKQVLGGLKHQAIGGLQRVRPKQLKSFPCAFSTPAHDHLTLVFRQKWLEYRFLDV